MSSKSLARRVRVEMSFDGTDITDDIQGYLSSLSFTDNEEDAADDLTVELMDTGGEWLNSWAGAAVLASATEKKITARIIRQNWEGDGADDVMDCGEFELDDVSLSAPPSVCVLKATSLTYSAAIRKTKNTKEWKNTSLSEIAGKIASKGGLTLLYECSEDPHFEREEQYKQSDIAFLSELCHDRGISLKVTDGQLVLFSQRKYEQAAAVDTIRRSEKTFTSYTLSTGEASTKYGSCTVSRVEPDTGNLIKGTATDDEGDKDHKLSLNLPVTDTAQAEKLASAYLRYYNKNERSATFVFPGNPLYCAGMNLSLEGFGMFDDKYVISKAVHSVSESSGYTTTVTLRKAVHT